jgi:hypothetical protein
MLVSLPAVDQPGVMRGGLAFAWLDGSSEEMALGWEVRPRLKAVPCGLILRRSTNPVERSIVIESDGLPFQVTGAASSLLAERVALPTDPAIRHKLEIKLNVANLPPDRAVNVTFATNHPGQSSVDVSVLVIPDTEGKRGPS